MTNETAIVPVKQSIVRTMDDAERAATAMAKSGYFQDSREIAQAVVKILAGQEMGFGPFASMNGIHIIKGKPGIGANLMAAAVKGSGKYDYKIREISDKVCRVEFFQGKESIGVSEFTIEDARKAGTQNIDRYPRNMLFARAMSNGVRWYCPDVFNGSAVYTPEELGATVDEEGEVINAHFTPASEPVQMAKVDAQSVKVEQPKPAPAAQPANGKNKAEPIARPYTPEQLKAKYAEAVAAIEKKGMVLGPDDYTITQNALQNLADTEKQREKYLSIVTGTPFIEDMNEAQIIAILRLLKPQSVGGAWMPCTEAEAEAEAVLKL